MTDLPADWAIGEALKRSAMPPHRLDQVHAYPGAYVGTLELARMIEKHVKPPVDPDVLAVREILAAWHETDHSHGASSAFGEGLRCGSCDDDVDFHAALAAYRKHRP